MTTWALMAVLIKTLTSTHPGATWMANIPFLSGVRRRMQHEKGQTEILRFAVLVAWFRLVWNDWIEKKYLVLNF